MDKEILTVIHDTEKFYEMKTNCLKYDLSFHMVKSIETAIENLLHSQNYVLILIYLDDLDIIGKLKKIRKVTKIPLLVVRNHHNGEEKIDAIEAGADEYIEWPKAVDEIIASCFALIRRFKELNQIEEKFIDDISFGDLTVSLYYHTILVNGYELDFPRREFDLLCLLASSPGRVFTFEQLSQEVWGDEYQLTENSLHSCVRRVRRKLESVPGNMCCIKNIRGVGYCFKENEALDSV